jgi:hypothetical protein
VGYPGIISRMDERRKLKKVNNEEGGNNHRRLKKELKRASGKAKNICLDSLCGEIVEFQRTGLHDLTYLKRREIGRKENQGIQTITIEDSQGHTISYQRHLLKIWEPNITQLYDPNNRLENLAVECEE